MNLIKTWFSKSYASLHNFFVSNCRKPPKANTCIGKKMEEYIADMKKLGFSISRHEDVSIDNFGFRMWMVNDNLHRLDGPAITWSCAGGGQAWWVNGKEITNEYDLTLFDSDEGRMILLLKYGSPI